MDRIPVRYAVLRDRRAWDEAVEMSALQPETDGVLTLARVPGAAGGAAGIVQPPPYDVDMSGLAAGPHGDLYLSETDRHVVIWLMGNCAAKGFKAGAGPGTSELKNPRGTALGSDALYVADSGNARVVVFDLPALEHRAVWEGLLQDPTGIACDSRDRIYVLDRGLNGVLRFDASGVADTAYNNAMSQHPELTHPIALALGDDDVLFVVDEAASAVLTFDADGRFAGSLPGSGAPARPRAAAVRGDRLYVADAASGWILVHQTHQGWLGTLDGYRGPVSAMTFDSTGRLYIKPGLDDSCITLDADAAYVSTGVLIGGPFDAGDLSEWERVHVDADVPAGTTVELRLFTAAPSAIDPTKPARVPAPADWLDPQTLSSSLDTLARLPMAADGVIRESGRFLWIHVRLATGDAQISPRVRQAQAATTGVSYLEHLPAIYAENASPDSFFARWLALFRAGLGDWNQALDRISRRFDAATSPEDSLRSLAEWVAFTLPPQKDAEDWRRLLADVHRLYERRGTVSGFSEFCELYAGVRPHVVEAFRDQRVWRLDDPSSALGLDTALAPALPDGMVVPGFTYADPAFMGLRGDYYRGTSFDRLQLSRIDPAIEFDWQLGSPAPGVVDGDYFSVRWTGQVQPRYSEVYTFRVASDDGVRLWVDGRLLIDDWREHGRTENRGQIALTGGRWYDITLEYFDALSASSVSLSWSSRSQLGEIVPQERLYALVDEGATLRAESGAAPTDTLLVGQTVVGDSGPVAAADYGLPLFSDTAHLFTVTVPALPTLAQRQRLERIIRAEKPAHTDFHLCFAGPRMRVGVQARIGVDAIVSGDPDPMALGEAALGMDSVLGGPRGTHS